MAYHLAEPRDIDPETNAALAHLARHDAPPSRAAGQGSDALVRAVPVALAAFDAPRTLVSATYHIAALTHPDPVVAWSAVAVNVALARFLQGERDFVPDVIEALRNNEVPEPLLAAVRGARGTAPRPYRRRGPRRPRGTPWEPSPRGWCGWSRPGIEAAALRPEQAEQTERDRSEEEVFTVQL